MSTPRSDKPGSDPGPEGSRIRMAAVGDLLFARPLGSRDLTEVFRDVRAVFDECDLVFGNLECTLEGDGQTVETEPRVVTAPEVVRCVHAAGFSVVSLANNHMFDCLEPGFRRVRELLDELGVAYCGSGESLAAASAPAIVEINGIRVALLAAADERSGTSRFAGPDQPGVAPMDTGRLAAQIAELTQQVDHVIVSPHWGEERMLFPAPEQIAQARALVEAGASMVLGHHPHVIQGMEVYREAPIVYSLGSFVADEVPYSDGDVLTWNRTERTGCVLRVDLTKDGVVDVKQIATYDDGLRVQPDHSGFGDRRIARANRALAAGVSLRRYRRQHLWVKTIRPILQHLRWSHLKRIRPRTIRNAFARIAQAIGAR